MLSFKHILRLVVIGLFLASVSACGGNDPAAKDQNTATGKGTVSLSGVVQN